MTIKLVEHLLRPSAAFLCRRLEREYDAAASTPDPTLAFTLHVIATEVGRAVDCALGIQNQTAVWVSAIARELPCSNPLEAVKHLLCPPSVLCLGRAQLEHGPAVPIERPIAASVSTAVLRRAVKIARAIENQITLGKLAILAAFEAVQNLLCPRAPFGTWRLHLVNRPASYFSSERAVSAAAVGCCAVEISGLIEDHSTRRSVSVSVSVALKDMDHGLGPGVALLGRRSKLQNSGALRGSTEIRATVGGCSV